MQKPLGALRRKAHFEVRAFLSEAHHMLNIYFMIFMMVVLINPQSDLHMLDVKKTVPTKGWWDIM